MKRSLIFAFLLAVFLLQGTMAALGFDLALLPQQGTESTQLTVAQEGRDLTAADELTVSSAIEELSDYAVAVQPALSARTRVADSSAAPLFFLSIIPLTAKPPPRA